MRLYYSNFKTNVNIDESCFISLNTYDNMFCIELEKNESVLISNFTLKLNEQINIEGTHSFPIVWDLNYESKFIIKANGKTLSISFKLSNATEMNEFSLDNLQSFVSQISTYFDEETEYPLEDIMQRIKENDISLLLEKKPITGFDDQDLMRLLKDTFSKIMHICSHPKQKLKTEEIIQDVNLVKRINLQTFNHLASHSEHWKKRKLNGVEPSRLKSDIFEDDIDIYENLFFRMAIDDICDYLNSIISAIKEVIERNEKENRYEDFAKYFANSNKINVYKKLMPTFDESGNEKENDVLNLLLASWEKLGQNYENVKHTSFYMSIDKKKRISRNVHLTNILRKESSYHSLYNLWCTIRKINVQNAEKNQSIIPERININNYYSAYISVLLNYIIYQVQGMEINNNSKFILRKDGVLDVSSKFESDDFIVNIKTIDADYLTSNLKMEFIKKNRKEIILTDDIVSFDNQDFKINVLDAINKKLPKNAELKNGKIVFKDTCTEKEISNLKNALDITNEELERIIGLNKFGNNIGAMRTNSAVRPLLGFKDNYNRIKKDFKSLINDNAFKLMSNNKNSKEVTLVPRFLFFNNVEPDKAELFIHDCLEQLLDDEVLLLPINLDDYDIIDSEITISKLLNYGERYYSKDIKYGNYRKGVIPVSRVEIDSARRLNKLISLYMSRLIMETNDYQCPICKNMETIQIDNNRYCKSCDIVFGKTKDADGCGDYYNWIRPNIDIPKRLLKTDNKVKFVEYKDILLDDRYITDFDIVDVGDGNVKLNPICPKCGRKL